MGSIRSLDGVYVNVYLLNAFSQSLTFDGLDHDCSPYELANLYAASLVDEKHLGLEIGDLSVPFYVIPVLLLVHSLVAYTFKEWL